MSRVKPKYVATTTLIDGVPALNQIAELPTPVTDKILFYNNDTGEMAYLETGANLTIDGATLDADTASSSNATGLMLMGG